jgi:hypothetical protein
MQNHSKHDQCAGMGRVMPLQSWLTAPEVMLNCRATSA